MTITIIITLCILLLTAYVFDLTSSKTKIPSVILLLLLGWLVHRLANLLQFNIPDLSPLLPVLGTIGLILIVLEGSLELELNKSKTGLIARSFFVATIPMFLLAAGLTFLLQHFNGASFKDCLTNSIPLCIISSAIAIPSVQSLTRSDKEFVIYESSLSDIIGVLLFNFVALNDNFGLLSVGRFGFQLVLISIISFVATIGLAFLLHRINHHIKFVPIALLVILIYAFSKVYHLPGLIFILLFGLFLGNLDELRRFKLIEKLKPDELNIEVRKFKDLIIEGAFLIRALFFLLFGYLINSTEIFNTETLLWALAIIATIFALRFLFLKLFSIPLLPLLFIAPRGLITILLFLAIEPSHTISLVNNSLIIQVVIISALLMMFGLLAKKSS